jgi:rhodanese-related sulfurtransferase
MPATTNITPLPRAVSSNTNQVSEQAPGHPLSPTSQVQSLEECEVIAKIDGQVIQACEVLWQVKMVMEKNRSRIPPEQEEEVYQTLMQQQITTLVDTKILYADFLRNVPKQNLHAIQDKLSEPFEEQQLPRLIKQFNATDVDDLQLKLVNLGTSLNDLKQAFLEQTIAHEWMRASIEFNDEVTHDEMLAYYREHLAEYEYPTQVRWEELMVQRNRFTNRGKAITAICEMGNQAYQAAVAGKLTGPIFTEIAQAKSHGWTAKKGGLHDWTTQGALKTTAIDQALFTLQIGQLSNLIESSTGFHIVRVLERKQAGCQPFREVQFDIVKDIQQARYRMTIDNHLEKIRSLAQIWTVYTGTTSFEMLAKPPDGPPRR